MKNARQTLIQIITIIGLPPWKEGEVENFLAFAQVGAMVDLTQGLPIDKQEPFFNQLLFQSPREVEQLFGRYYTLAQIQEAVIARTALEPAVVIRSRMPIVLPAPGSATITCQLRLCQAERSIA